MGKGGSIHLLSCNPCLGDPHGRLRPGEPVYRQGRARGVLRLAAAALGGALRLRRLGGHLDRRLPRQGGDDPAIIGQWKRLAEGEPDVHRRADYGGLALVFAELAGRLAAWRQALEGWSMQQSQQVLEWQREAEIRQMQSVILEGINRRFRVDASGDLRESIEGSTDLAQLRQWCNSLFEADTFDAFRAALGLNTSPGPSTSNGEEPSETQG
jgi:hypothetical protein